jgi:hypothetical protein
VFAWYFPESHELQDADPAELSSPAGHISENPSPTQNVLAGQSSQDVRVASDPPTVYLPGIWQSLQELLPASLYFFTLPQGSLVPLIALIVLTPLQKYPASHGTQRGVEGFCTLSM